jgi:hypothetical protein
MNTNSNPLRHPAPRAVVRTRVLLASVVATLLAACGGDDAANGTPAGSKCRRDPTRIAQAADCRRDDDCPCGAHCTLGLCAADCLADADCADGRCDLFGRCRDSDDLARIPALRPAGRGTAVLANTLLRAGNPTAVRTLRFRIAADTPQDVRIDVDDGLEVSCDEATTFGPECRIEDAPPDQELTVQVRGAGAIPAEGLGIRVFVGETMTTATFTDEPVGDREPV